MVDQIGVDEGVVGALDLRSITLIKMRPSTNLNFCCELLDFIVFIIMISAAFDGVRVEFVLFRHLDEIH